MNSRFSLKDTEIYPLHLLKEKETQLMKGLLLARASMKNLLEAYAARLGLVEGDLSVVQEDDGQFWIVSTLKPGAKEPEGG